MIYLCISECESFYVGKFAWMTKFNFFFYNRCECLFRNFQIAFDFFIPSCVAVDSECISFEKFYKVSVFYMIFFEKKFLLSYCKPIHLFLNFFFSKSNHIIFNFIKVFRILYYRKNSV